VNLGRLATWSPLALWQAEPDHGRAAAAELEQLGYGTIWLGNGPAVLEVAEELLAATRAVTVATGVLNVWTHPDADRVAATASRLDRCYPGRFLLGLGSGPRSAEEAAQSAYRKLNGYLDQLDRAGIDPRQRVLGSLGPRMLALAAARSAGAFPLLTTPEHTKLGRRLLGQGPLLAVEQGIVLDTDPARARETARRDLAFYLPKASYRRTLGRLGFTEDDLAEGGSDRLVDGLVPNGVPAISARIGEHLAAGADHVAIQPLTSGTHAESRDRSLPREEFRQLAVALGSF